MNGFEIFHQACYAADTESYIREMSDSKLRKLIGEAGRNATDNNISGQILGIALVEAAERFVKNQQKEEPL